MNKHKHVLKCSLFKDLGFRAKRMNIFIKIKRFRRRVSAHTSPTCFKVLRADDDSWVLYTVGWLWEKRTKKRSDKATADSNICPLQMLYSPTEEISSKWVTFFWPVIAAPVVGQEVSFWNWQKSPQSFIEKQPVRSKILQGRMEKGWGLRKINSCISKRSPVMSEFWSLDPTSV